MSNRLPLMATLWWALSPLAAVGAPGPQSEHRYEERRAEPTAHGPFDLDAIVALALGENPGLKAQEERRSEVRGGVREARADAFPQWSVSTGWDLSRDPSLLNSADFEDIVASFPGGDFEPARQELFNLKTEIRQPLFTWGKLGAAVRLAHTVEEVTEAQIGKVRLDTALDAAVAFYQILTAELQITTLESQQRLREKELEVVRARLELGDATRLEMLRAKASLAQVRPGLEAARGDLSVAQSRLRRALGQPSHHPLQLTHSPGPVPPAPAAEALRRQALRTRPELLDLDQQQAALDLRMRIIRAAGKPQLDLTGAYGQTARLAEDLADPRFRDWRLALDFRWEFFDGGRRRGQIEQLESQRRQLAFQRQDLENQIHEEIEGSLARLKAADARWQAAERSAEASREAVRVAEESYREGVALQVDLLDARDQETEALLERNQAYFEAQSRWAQLMRAAGRLPNSRWPPAKSPAVPAETNRGPAKGDLEP